MKVLIIGLGAIARKHIKVLYEIDPNVELVTLRSGKNNVEEENLRQIFSYESIQNEEFSFAIISNPSHMHKETINKLIKYNIPLFIEKPVHSSVDLSEQIDKIKKAGIKTYVACNLRFLDSIKYFKSRCGNPNSKRINEINVYCGSYLPEWRPATDFRKHYSVNPEAGGGVHLDLIHEIDYIYWIFGKPDNVRRYFSNKSSLNINSIDYANFLLEYKDFTVNIILNYYRRDPKRSLEVIFDNETWFIDLINNNIKNSIEILFESNQRIIDTYKDQMVYFINTINNDVKPFNTINDGYETLKICLGDDIKG